MHSDRFLESIRSRRFENCPTGCQLVASRPVTRALDYMSQDVPACCISASHEHTFVYLSPTTCPLCRVFARRQNMYGNLERSDKLPACRIFGGCPNTSDQLTARGRQEPCDEADQ